MLTDSIDMDDSPRERLFEAFMRRFEAMEPHRDGITSLMNARDGMPFRRRALLTARRKSAHWALVCSGLDTLTGTEKTLKEIGLVWVLRQTELAWRRDTDGMFTHTMATLDEELALLAERLQRTEAVFSGNFFARDRFNNTSTEEGSTSPEPHQSETDPA